MKVSIGNFEQAATRAKSLIINKEEGLTVAISTETAFAVGVEPDTVNREAVDQMGDVVYDGFWKGGTCVVFEGDLSFCMISNDVTDFSVRCIGEIQKYLIMKGLTIRKQGNDLLWYKSKWSGECYKVASCGSAVLENGMHESVVHLSIGMDEEVIKAVCTKPVTKTPHGLKEQGITAEETLAYLRNVLPELKSDKNL